MPPKYLNVYKIQFRLAVQDPDIPETRYHTVVTTPSQTYPISHSKVVVIPFPYPIGS